MSQKLTLRHGAGGPAGVGPHSGLAPVGAGAEPPQGDASSGTEGTG